uniref:Uncharacterized protein n=1 Tax=Ananas comosus var. bracteatus TaxID=296719 RepID=A0A6V7PBJ5_ANACO|nr:unnamed protein product [Ananas comosus var. bracteatus]
MSHQRLNHSFESVPFSWENQPGMSKVSPHMDNSPTKLPPPPAADRLLRAKLYVPLPPCRIQAPKTILLTKKGDTIGEDPFLAAYIECTKSVRKPLDKVSVKERIRRENRWSGVRKLGLGLSLSCKRDSGVREDNLVRMSQLPEVDSRGFED